MAATNLVIKVNTTANDTTDSGNFVRSEEHTSELQSHSDLVCRRLLEKKNKKYTATLSNGKSLRKR